MFLIKIWKGEASLGFTFWIMGVFMLVIFRVFEVATASISIEAARAGFLISMAYFFMYSIALWRTAANVEEDVKYALLARLFILAGWGRYALTAILGSFFH